jgi:glycosyltransferase involved in cell wall biosynthesis
VDRGRSAQLARDRDEDEGRYATSSASIPVSVVVLTKNEEVNVEKCLQSVGRFAEVFVVDSGSADRTAEIALRLGARIVQFEWNGRYPKKKQWALESLPFAYRWVLYLDADEEVPPALAEEIERLMRDGPRHEGYFAALDYVFLGKVLRRGQRVYKLVLLDRAKGRFLDYDDLEAANMWEVEGHYQPMIDGSTGRLKARLVHNDQDSLYAYFARHNRYSDWEAVLRRKRKLVNRKEAQPGLRKVSKRVFAALPFRGLVFFLFSYVVRFGFLDGRAGYHYAIAKSFYYWQAGVKAKELELRER